VSNGSGSLFRRGQSGGVATGELYLEGVVERVTYESAESSFRVLRLSTDEGEAVTVVGTFPRVAPGARIRVRGSKVTDARHGEQIKALSITELLPTTLVGIRRYLGSGLIKGIGEGYANKIVDAFGLETLRVLDEEPERLALVPGLGKKRVETLIRGWHEQRAVREVMVFLQAHGASPALATRIYKRYGKHAINVVSRDPYRLSLDVWGVGFKTADRIAQELGVARDGPARVQAGVLQSMHDATDSGHTCVPASAVAARALALLELEGDDLEREAKIGEAVRALAKGGYVVEEDVPGAESVVFLADLHAAERRFAARLLELARAPARPLSGAERALAEFERRAKVSLAPEQRQAVERAAKSGVLVITGGPGVGKTTIVRAVLSVYEHAGLRVRLAAPTGRAAKRLSQSTDRDASTLHRLLEFEPKRAAFKRSQASPLEVDALVVDEASMIDLPMADAIAQAIVSGTRLVLVGDVDQLPSVGPGAVLRDVIQSGAVPTVRLTQIFRQAEQSLIVQNAHRINQGEAPIAPPAGAAADFYLIDRRDPESAKETILELVASRIPKRFGHDPVRDIQVLTPMHRGAAGSMALNEAMQALLNPTGPSLTRAARLFRLGDKVMQLRNDYEREVWNGDVGIVSQVDEEEGVLFVRFDEEREIRYEAGELDELTLAYACSIHKSQGSEYPVVVLPLLTAHFVMLSRNLLYTAVTRGKRLVVLVYDPRALSLALAEDRRGERHTRLAARLSEGHR
jgi:exodeoxyribonuclease V alpha subunit